MKQQCAFFKREKVGGDDDDMSLELQADLIIFSL